MSKPMSGKEFESYVALECQQIYDTDHGVVLKMPTPYNILTMGDHGRFRGVLSQSTVDFTGVVDGVAFAIECKATEDASVKVYCAAKYKGSGLKLHQRNFLANFRRALGVALVYVCDRNGRRHLLPVSGTGRVAGVDPAESKSYNLQSDRFVLLDCEDWLDGWRARYQAWTEEGLC